MIQGSGIEDIKFFNDKHKYQNIENTMKLKLLFLPRYHADPNTGEKDFPPFFPPLGIATLTSFLRGRDIDVDQDDLNIKTVRRNMDSKHEDIDLEKFFDPKRIKDFFKDASDPDLEGEARKIVEMTDIKGYDVVGLSLMPTDNPSTAGVALAVSKIIKERYNPEIVIGGSISSVDAEKKLLQTGYIDHRILGNPSLSSGETNLLDFCRRLEKNRKIEETYGLTGFKNGEYFYNEEDYDRSKKNKGNKPNL